MGASLIKTLRVIHRWLGLVLLLPMLSQGVTGCILAVTPLWARLASEPAVGAGPSRSASAILAAAAQPGLAAVLYRPALPGHPALVELAAPGHRGADVQVVIDPASLAVLGLRHPSVLYRWVRSLHENLLLPGLAGRSIVGGFGVGLLVLGLSGLVLWWPAALAPNRWRRAVTVTPTAKGARFQRELHAATGFWVSAMLVVMSVSGIPLGFPQTIRSLLGVPNPFPRHMDGAAALDIDAVLQRAQAAAPGAVVTEMRLPAGPERPVSLWLQRPDALPGTPPTMLVMDPAGRTVIAVQGPGTEPAAALALGWLRALHYGEAFGAGWRVLVALCGAALPLLAVSGATLWVLKRRNRLRLANRRRAALQAVAE